MSHAARLVLVATCLFVAVAALTLCGLRIAESEPAHFVQCSRGKECGKACIAKWKVCRKKGYQ